MSKIKQCYKKVLLQLSVMHVAGNFFNEDAQTLLWLYQHYFAKFKNYDKNQTMLQKGFITVVSDRI